MKILRVLFRVLLGLVILIATFLAVSVAPINHTPVQEKPEYQAMMQQLDTLNIPEIQKTSGFKVGVAKVNITPDQPTTLAGYLKRKGKAYEYVHDSIYVRTMVIDNGVNRVAVVSADLLIVPPTVTVLLEQQLPAIGFSIESVYLGAVHTHNSIGNWGEGVTGLIFGAYEDSVTHFIADRIMESITLASKELKPATFRTKTIPLPEAVGNRLIDHGPVDSLVRVLEVQRADSMKFIALSYTAHATCLFSRDLFLSRDYPGTLVDVLEKSGYDFAMFFAGSVGSHTCAPPEYGVACLDWMAEKISNSLTTNQEYHTIEDSTLHMIRVPLLLPKSQAKIAKDWRIRSWLFRSAFGEYPVYLTALRIGDFVLMGTPCDFSGEMNKELDLYANAKGRQLMVTSFNGGYIGYVTPTKYYDVDHYETRIMNWYGLGTAEYLSSCMKKILDKI